jgi:hypothetical protein
MKRDIPVLSILFAVVASSAILAQDAIPDGFSAGATCTPATGTLPAFPTTSLGGLAASISNCGLEAQLNTTTTLTPTQVLSDYLLIGLTIDAQPAFSIASQVLVAKYARTWLELSSTGVPLQVWRFLVNGDFAYTPGTAALAGSQIPLSALPPYDLPVHFIGNVDFAKNMATGAWEVSYTLSHFCPVESHASFSQRPIPEASGWSNRTYHFVGPSNFVFDAYPSPSGPIVGESSRRSTGMASTGPYTTFNEAGLHRGLVVDALDGFDCVGANGSMVVSTPRYMHQNIFAASEFDANQSQPVASVPIGLATLPTGLRGLGIGKFLAAPGASYPGEEFVSVYLGVLNAPGLCPSPGSPLVHAVTGVGTAGGNPVILLETPLPLIALDALDLHDMNVLTPFGFTPGFGSLFGSERVWSFSML